MQVIADERDRHLRELSKDDMMTTIHYGRMAGMTWAELRQSFEAHVREYWQNVESATMPWADPEMDEHC